MRAPAALGLGLHAEGLVVEARSGQDGHVHGPHHLLAKTGRDRALLVELHTSGCSCSSIAWWRGSQALGRSSGEMVERNVTWHRLCAWGLLRSLPVISRMTGAPAGDLRPASCHDTNCSSHLFADPHLVRKVREPYLPTCARTGVGET